MWDEIKKNGICAYVVNEQGKFAFSIPEGTASLTADRLIRMMEWIYAEFHRDCEDHPDIFSSFSKNFKNTEEFTMRNTSRILSYINLACSLELVLRRIYTETISSLQIIDNTIALNEAFVLVRKTEVKDIFTFRNKVSAHTTYGSPGSTDNAALEFHSLVALLSSSFDVNGGSGSFGIGDVSVNLGNQTPSTKLPRIGLEELFPKMKQHQEEWAKMIIDPCIQARQFLPVTIGDTTYQI